MPRLNGKPFKFELRAEIRELKKRLRDEQAEHLSVRHSLQYAYARIEALENKLKTIEQSVVSETERDLAAETFQRMRETRRREFAIIAEQAAKEQAAY